MKRASFREGVRWIAFNDESRELDPEVMASLISVGLLADLFGKTPEEVACAVVRFRLREQKRERRGG